jgi:fluoroacetyl-CoA thioesterase
MQPLDGPSETPSPGDDTVTPADGQTGPAVGRAHVRGAPGRGLDATTGWVGATTRVQLTVTDADTAQAVGSGDVPVLGTPRVLALVEAATVAATANRLPPGATTVGARVELEHRAATAVGRTVVAEARLAKADGRRLTFEVSVREGDTVVADGRVERILVDRQRFLQKAFGN